MAADAMLLEDGLHVAAEIHLLGEDRTHETKNGYESAHNTPPLRATLVAKWVSNIIRKSGAFGLIEPGGRRLPVFICVHLCPSVAHSERPARRASLPPHCCQEI